MFKVILLTLALVSSICHPVSAAGEAESSAAMPPGRIMGPETPELKSSFARPWSHRSLTYEIYHQDAARLAGLVYVLARHSGDIDASMTPERFVGGVKGFHYEVSQVCAWLNDLTSGKSADPVSDEMVLAGLLLQDGVLKFKGGRFVPGGDVRHVLGAAPGRQRTFAENLRHERLHVLWDEDQAFREKSLKEWEGLSDDEKKSVIRKLSQYAVEAQVIEEWAIGQAEQRKSID